MDVPSVVNRFHRIVLAWDYFGLRDRSEEGKGVYDELQSVPNTFESMQAYKEVFEPLVLEECGAQVLRGIEEGQLIEPNPAVVSACSKAGDFHTARISLTASRQINDNDLVLLTKDNPEDEKCRRQLHALGFVEGHEGEVSIRVKFYLTDDSQAGNTAGQERVRAMRAGIEAKDSCWWLLRLFNMSTITREWVALQHVQLLPFAEALLRGQPMVRPSIKGLGIPTGMRAAMEAQCNSSQMAALQSGLDGSPLVLIQGPPGTGKTRTILNLLSVVMHAAAKGSLELMPRAVSTKTNGNTPGAAAAAGDDGGAAAGGEGEDGEGGEDGDVSEERLRLWALQSPWMFGLPSTRERVLPGPDTGMPMPSDDCFGLSKKAPVLKLSSARGPRAHVLVCAPSNSALDEIVLRILQHGLMDGEGQVFAPSVVRIGVNVHHSVQEVSLEALVDKRLGGGDDSGVQVSGLQRERMKLQVLQEASVVASTLSFAGSAVFHRLGKHFDVVIIDEAAQAVEPSTLVPLVHGCKQVYLVGDPVQLPATVISTTALDLNYDCSMFKRLQGAGYPVRVLNEQYRMHPSISAFPSQEFYQGKLLDGKGVAERTTREWHRRRCFGPFAFYDIHGKEDVPEGGASLQNRAEAMFVLCIYMTMVREIPELNDGTASVAIISPYKAQVKLLRDLFNQGLTKEKARMVDINTIDGFQGREKDVVIFSCVRTAGVHNRSIGFVADERRINVGLTRARCALIVIGHAESLIVDQRWLNLVSYAVDNHMLWQPGPAPYTAYMSKVAAGEVGPANISNQMRLKLGMVQHVSKAGAKASGSKQAGTSTAGAPPGKRTRKA